jgi:hypothetical protein
MTEQKAFQMSYLLENIYFWHFNNLIWLIHPISSYPKNHPSLLARYDSFYHWN